MGNLVRNGISYSGAGGDATVPSMTLAEYKAQLDKYKDKIVNIEDGEGGVITAEDVAYGDSNVKDTLDGLNTKLHLKNLGTINQNFNANTVEKNTICEINAWDDSVINLPHNWGILETVSPSDLYTEQTFYGADGKVYTRFLQTGLDWKEWVEISQVYIPNITPNSDYVSSYEFTRQGNLVYLSFTTSAECPAWATHLLIGVLTSFDKFVADLDGHIYKASYHGLEPSVNLPIGTYQIIFVAN